MAAAIKEADDEDAIDPTPRGVDFDIVDMEGVKHITPSTSTMSKSDFISLITPFKQFSAAFDLCVKNSRGAGPDYRSVRDEFASWKPILGVWPKCRVGRDAEGYMKIKQIP